MTIEPTAPTAEQKTADKELNFRKMEAYYESKLAQERAEKEEALRLAKEASLNAKKQEEDEEDDSDPYVDRKKLQKKLDKIGQSTQSEIQKAMELAKRAAKDELKQEMWLDQNPDFYETLKLSDKLYEANPHLSHSILRMPESFERQQLVYENIKALGIGKPAEKGSSIQDKLDQNRRGNFYQPSSQAMPAYNSSQSDFSASGQKQAYEKMKELQKSLRI